MEWGEEGANWGGDGEGAVVLVDIINIQSLDLIHLPRSTQSHDSKIASTYPSRSSRTVRAYSQVMKTSSLILRRAPGPEIPPWDAACALSVWLHQCEVIT